MKMKFRVATVDEVVEWLRGRFNARGSDGLMFIDAPYNEERSLYALGDFRLMGECGAHARQIIVPGGVSWDGPLGHCCLMTMATFSIVSEGIPVLVTYHPSMMTVPGLAEWITAEKRRKDEEERRSNKEWDARERAMIRNSDLSRYLNGA